MTSFLKWFLLSFLLICGSASAVGREHVTLILKWDHQFQFAGFYAAQWQGFYAAEGLDVDIVPRVQPDGSLLDLPAMMMAGDADFAVGGSDILLQQDEGMPFVLLACLFQRSPFAFVVPAASSVRTPADMAHARIGTSGDFGFFELTSLFMHEGVDAGGVSWQPYHFALSGLIENKEDVSVDYFASADWASKEKNYPVRFITAEDYGLNFYGDLIYTRRDVIEKRPDVVAAFVRASLKGWEYALDHAEQIAGDISQRLPRTFRYKDINAFNLHQAEVIKKLMNYPTTSVGHVNISRWQKIHQNLREMGVVKHDFDVDGFYVFEQDLVRRPGRGNLYVIVFFSLLSIVLLFSLYYAWRKIQSGRMKEQDFKSAIHLSGGIVVMVFIDSKTIRLSRSWQNDAGGEVVMSFAAFSAATNESELVLAWFNGLPESMRYRDLGVQFGGEGEKKYFNLRINEAAGSSGALLGILSDVTSQYLYKLNLEYLNAELDGRVTEALIQYRVAIDDLEQSQYMLQTVLDALPASVYWKNKAGMYLGSNVAFSRDAGFINSGTMLGYTDADMPWSEEEKIRLAQDDAAVLGGESARINMSQELTNALGETRHIKMSKIPLHDKSGEVDGVLGVYLDVTSEFEALNEIRKKSVLLESLNGRLLSVLNSSPDVIFFKDYAESEGRYLGCNRAFEEWVGRSQQDVLGKEDRDLFSEDKARLYRDEDMNILLQRRRIAKEGWITLANGKNVYMETVKAPIYDSTSKVVGVLGIGRDVTAKRQAESLYRTIYSVSHDAFLLINAEGVIESCNQAAVKLLGGVVEGDLVGLYPIKDLSPEYQNDGVRSVDRVKVNNNILNEKGSLLCDWTHKALSGQLIYTEVFLAKLSGDNEGRVFAQLHNLTDRVERQQQLEQARRLAEEADRAKSGFLANISHEIRTPLNAILGFAQLAAHNKKNAEDYVERINKSARQLLGIVNDTLDFAKIESGHMELDFRVFNLRALVDDVFDLYKTPAQLKNIKLLLEDHSEDSCWLGDDIRIKQILGNLLGNAIKFTREGKVVLRVSVEGGNVKFRITDQGIGMSAEQQTKLFVPFSQADSSTTRIFGGTGLGLSIVKKLVDIMKGSIEVHSSVGNGSRFTVVLPLQPAAQEALPAEPDVIPDFTGKVILLVEDNEINQLIAREMLQDTKATVISCDNGQEAVDFLQSGMADLVVMDIQMPVMDGYEATRIIRRQYSADALPIVAMTANAMSHEREEGMACGMNAYVTKPIEQRILYETLSACLS